MIVSYLHNWKCHGGFFSPPYILFFHNVIFHVKYPTLSQLGFLRKLCPNTPRLPWQITNQLASSLWNGISHEPSWDWRKEVIIFCVLWSSWRALLREVPACWLCLCIPCSCILTSVLAKSFPFSYMFRWITLMLSLTHTQPFGGQALPK